MEKRAMIKVIFANCGTFFIFWTLVGVILGSSFFSTILSGIGLAGVYLWFVFIGICKWRKGKIFISITVLGLGMVISIKNGGGIEPFDILYVGYFGFSAFLALNQAKKLLGE